MYCTLWKDDNSVVLPHLDYLNWLSALSFYQACDILKQHSEPWLFKYTMELPNFFKNTVAFYSFLFLWKLWTIEFLLELYNFFPLWWKENYDTFYLFSVYFIYSVLWYLSGVKISHFIIQNSEALYFVHLYFCHRNKWSKSQVQFLIQFLQ